MTDHNLRDMEVMVSQRDVSPVTGRDRITSVTRTSQVSPVTGRDRRDVT